MTENTHKIEIGRRHWYTWLAWLLWIFALGFSFQNAVASGAEYEPTPAIIFWATFAVLLVGGVIVYYVRRLSLA